MCAIVDANVANDVFGDSPAPAGERFLNWVNRGSGRLVGGGKLLRELERGSPGFRQWAITGIIQGKMLMVDDDAVNTRTDELDGSGNLASDDPHVIALAQLSGARLLYSNDAALQRDFRSAQLLNNPRGRVYSTDPERNPTKRFTTAHRDLLNRRDLCVAAR